jgi:hypothetical protein
MSEKQPTLQDEVSQEIRKPGLWNRFRNEFSTSFFDLEDKEIGRLDMNKNFNIGEKCFSWVLLLKFILAAGSFALFVMGWVDEGDPWYYPAYLTFWQVVYGTIYVVSSFFLTACGTRDNGDDDNISKSYLFKFTWLMYAVASVYGLVVMLLFWAAVWDGNGIKFIDDIWNHGGLFLVVILDGAIINRVPLRIKHTTVTFLLSVLYLIWSVLQNTVVVVNPAYDEDDDALYDIMKWREKTLSAVITSLVLLFVIVPLFTILFWCISLPGRHYQSDYTNDHGTTTKDRLSSTV